MLEPTDAAGRYQTGETTYYTDGADPLPASEREHRKIVGLTWENRYGWRLETKLCNDLTGTSTNYVVKNEVLIRMVRESTRNRFVQLRSDL